MKVVYQCFGGAHSSVVAAAIHLRILPSDAVPPASSVNKLERFDRTSDGDMGVPHFMGHDEEGHEVYSMGVGAAKSLAVAPLLDLLYTLGAGRNEVLLAPTLQCIGVLTRVGGFLSRSARFTLIGRPLVLAGIRLDYMRLSRRVECCRKALRASEGGAQ